MKHKMIRGRVANERCENVGTWGSPLYCDCGCQTPQEGDPEINLEGVSVSRQSASGYADYILSRDGKDCGSLNTQYCALSLDGNQFLGIDRQYLQALIDEALAIPDRESINAGSTLEETAVIEQLSEELDLAELDNRNHKHFGYCTQCHSYCYGDCNA